MRLISGGRHHATFEFGDLTVTSLRDGYVDMPPTRLRDVSGRTLARCSNCFDRVRVYAHA
jgi:hypothetical protein